MSIARGNARSPPGFEDALDNTARIAERCNVDFTFGELKLPKFTVEGVTDNAAYFRKRCFEA
jgi:DNA polymerase-3 subunit alpha